MKNVKLLLIMFAIVSIAFMSCKKEESTPDYASIIAGTFNGTITIGANTVAASTTIKKNTETMVDLSIVIGTTTVPLSLINVSSAGNNVYNLKYSGVTDGSFEGKVDRNKLTWTLISGNTTQVFSGTE